MRVKVQKWGNSLALRIPKPFAQEARVKQGTLVDLSLSDGKLVAAPIRGRSFTLEQLLAKVTNDNIHGEVDFGQAVGRESW
ncbi:MAG TPA: AbrB/MazE/SpoVT family DNA-binding domain-containing protein [Acidobacteriota bacterium]|jgi:antitoxin MazE